MFTRYVGVSPKAFVGQLTLDRAKAELAAGSSVFDAALEAGLSGPSRLHDLCIKIEAMTPGDYARGGEGLAIDYGFESCPFGIVLAMATEKGVCGLAFGQEGEEPAMLADMTRRWPKANYREAPARITHIVREIFSADGNRDREIGLHLLGTPWQIKVWQALLAIPSGRVTTYRNIADQVQSPRASRAVGTAVGCNPISWLIPCHRVLGSDGARCMAIIGDCRAKRAMLAFEAARAQSDRPSTSAIA